jgi:hypothetical protein
MGQPIGSQDLFRIDIKGLALEVRQVSPAWVVIAFIKTI